MIYISEKEMTYWPCVCQNRCECTAKIECSKVPTEQIRKAFEEYTTFQVEILLLELAENESKIPKDIFSQHSATNIALFDTHRNPQGVALEIHPEAFRYSRNVTKHFILTNFEMFNFSWTFLAEFDQLGLITINKSFHVQLINLPPLPRLTGLHIRYSTGLNNWTHLPLLSNGLESLFMNFCGLNNEEADRILNWVQSGPSKGTLLDIYLGGNALTRIPGQLKSFPTLNEININDQKPPGLGIISDLSFLSPVSYLDLSSNHISEIQSGTFQGFRNIICFDLFIKCFN